MQMLADLNIPWHGSPFSDEATNRSPTQHHLQTSCDTFHEKSLTLDKQVATIATNYRPREHLTTRAGSRLSGDGQQVNH